MILPNARELFGGGGGFVVLVATAAVAPVVVVFWWLALAALEVTGTDAAPLDGGCVIVWRCMEVMGDGRFWLPLRRKEAMEMNRVLS